MSRMPCELVDARQVEHVSVAEVLARLGAGEGGLGGDEARRRLVHYGRNSIEEKRAHPLRKFLSYFWGPIPWMIEAAALLSAVVSHWADFGIIVVLLFVNAGIGFWQEYKADNAIALLKQKLALMAQALRDGRWTAIAAQDLVPGDIVRVRLGDIVPADLKLLRGEYLSVDQSALTGESLPVEKRAGDVAYSGTIVQRGEMDAVVVGTGMRTYLGRTAGLVERAHTESHYQRAVLQVGRFLILSTIALIGVVLLTALFRETPLLETLQFALVLTVAAIPVALPAVLSVAMAVGAMRLARRQAIVSRLVSIEEMAGMDVLCCDKTGTLTQNRLVLGDPQPLALDVTPADLVRAAALASQDADKDPIEHAIFGGLEGGQASLAAFETERFEPFDPVRKLSNAVIREGDRRFEVAKGAPQTVLGLCEDGVELKQRVSAAVEELAVRGYRTLGVARRDPEAPWRFLGVVPLYDPPREDSAKTLRDATVLGVAVKMVTGDHLAIARETAKQLEIGTEICLAEATLAGTGPVDDDLVERASGFAQVFPEHKFRIVESLQRRGHIVGMTGDGVNDAPALKKADVGIAVSGATDAARTAADLVLTAPGLSVIVDAIKEARRIFERMTSYAVYRIAETIRVLLFMTLAILVFDVYPVTAVMIILLALLNDGPIMMIAYDNTDASKRPVRWNMHEVLGMASVLGILGVFSSFGLFWLADRVLALDRQTVQTLMFLKLSVAGHMTIYLARSIDRPFWRRPLPGPALFWASECTQAVATLVAVFGIFVAPIGWKLAGLVWAYALGWFVVNEAFKRSAYRMLSHGGRRERSHIARIHGPLQAG